MTATGSGTAVRVRIERLADALAPAGVDWLNDVERARLERMGSARRRQQFVAGHWLARAMAAEHAGNSPTDWDLLADAEGAPQLRLKSGTSAALRVSLAHSDDRVGCALSTQPVGLDLETTTRTRDFDAVAAYTFAPEHAARVRALEGATRVDAFYRLWTLAEAHGKHAGHGLRPHETRELAWRECAPAEACGLTWQAGDVSLALWSAPGVRVEMSGLDAPAPGYWRVEPASG